MRNTLEPFGAVWINDDTNLTNKENCALTCQLKVLRSWWSRSHWYSLVSPRRTKYRFLSIWILWFTYAHVVRLCSVIVISYLWPFTQHFVCSNEPTTKSRTSGLYSVWFRRHTFHFTRIKISFVRILVLVNVIAKSHTAVRAHLCLWYNPEFRRTKTTLMKRTLLDNTLR